LRRIRTRWSSASRGRIATARLSAEDVNILAWLRTDPTETVLVAHNLGGSTATRALNAAGTAADPLLTDTGAALAAAGGAAWSVTLPPYGSGIWRLR